MCCPYELAAAYQFTSVRSLGVARNRAVGDERHVTFQEQQVEQDQEDRLRLQQVAAAAIAAATATATSLLLNAVETAVLEQKENQDDTSSINCNAAEKCEEKTENGNDNNNDSNINTCREKTNRIMDL
jgi:hypothetical protein